MAVTGANIEDGVEVGPGRRDRELAIEGRGPADGRLRRATAAARAREAATRAGRHALEHERSERITDVDRRALASAPARVGAIRVVTVDVAVAIVVQPVAADLVISWRIGTIRRIDADVAVRFDVASVVRAATARGKKGEGEDGGESHRHGVP